MKKGTYKHSVERLKKMSDIQKGHPVSEQTKEKIKAAHLGKRYSPKTEFKNGPRYDLRSRELITCLICNLKFEVKKSHAAKRKTCSKVCFGKYKGIQSKGKKIHSEEFKKRLSERNWKGGVTPVNQLIRSSAEYKLWRIAVFTRDNFTCVWGGTEHGNKLNADHIKPFAFFPELRFAIDNGRTLCEDCHRKTDTYAGRAKIKFNL